MNSECVAITTGSTVALRLEAAALLHFDPLYPNPVGA